MKYDRSWLKFECVTSSIDVTGLLEPQSREFWRPEIRDQQLQVEDSNGSSTTTVAVSVFVGAVMFIGLVASVLFYVQRRRRQMEREIEPERTHGGECSFTQFSSLIPHLITELLKPYNWIFSYRPPNIHSGQWTKSQALMTSWMQNIPWSVNWEKHIFWNLPFLLSLIYEIITCL